MPSEIRNPAPSIYFLLLSEKQEGKITSHDPIYRSTLESDKIPAYNTPLECWPASKSIVSGGLWFCMFDFLDFCWDFDPFSGFLVDPSQPATPPVPPSSFLPRESATPIAPPSPLSPGNSATLRRMWKTLRVMEILSIFCCGVVREVA
ncbi:unnamed protein product [Linum trigynum]|uniref:Uncharacterized protein n=1 Tax=Linum trigynum TaxID=586398 RepID=A0AAV2FQL1_9ROSI